MMSFRHTVAVVELQQDAYTHRLTSSLHIALRPSTPASLPSMEVKWLLSGTPASDMKLSQTSTQPSAACRTPHPSVTLTTLSFQEHLSLGFCDSTLSLHVPDQSLCCLLFFPQIAKYGGVSYSLFLPFPPSPGQTSHELQTGIFPCLPGTSAVLSHKHLGSSVRSRALKPPQSSCLEIKLPNTQTHSHP